jgi:transaldolase
MANPLLQLQEQGQSVWYDNVSRELLQNGHFQKLIDQAGVVGCTTNPTIFQKAIGSGNSYDDQIRQLVAQGKSLNETIEELIVKDISTIADLLRPIYDRTNGRDGYVSIEVSPLLAADSKTSIEVARHYFQIFNRPNVMVKIPATPEGLTAIEACISEGYNINITMMFALEVYEQVANAYLSGLEKLAESKQKPLQQVSSVASFFVSRVDTLVDKLLEERIARAGSQKEKQQLESLLGKAAIANSQLVYEKFEQIFNSPRFKKLEKQGARVQRVLWASTSAKNPAYRDVRYVEELIGPYTINTMPQQTIDAFADHGQVALTVNKGYDKAHQVFRQLEAAGISMQEVTAQLLDEGIKGFADSYRNMTEVVAKKRQEFGAK